MILIEASNREYMLLNRNRNARVVRPDANKMSNRPRAIVLSHDDRHKFAAFILLLNDIDKLLNANKSKSKKRKMNEPFTGSPNRGPFLLLITALSLLQLF